MREYEHFIIKGEILIPDHKSAKAKWGLHTPEYLDSESPDFLREGNTKFPQAGLVFQLTHESEPCAHSYNGDPVGNGVIIVEAQDYSGGYHEAGIHKNMIEWDY